MFSIIIRTNRQSSNHFLYFLHSLFLLHICTAFFTIVNALNNHENEAFIQLSIDSIHVVKPSDPRFANIEESTSDDEEKELLIALLTSFDDDHTNIKQIDINKPSKTTHNNEILRNNNCTSPSSSSSNAETTTTAASSSSSSSSIRFIPPLLDFGEQFTAIPRVQTVTIINDDSEPLELQSLSGTTVQFYSSFFTQKILSPNGGNTSINVYYLPRTLGTIKSTFTIKTNRRTVYYYVNGIGVLNPFHIRPLIGATIPLNSTFEYTINFFNPYNYSIDINEIFTSDENLIIELLSYKNRKTKIIKTFEHHEQWHIEPYQRKSIIKINYLAYKLDRLHGFYCIKTNSNDTIIVPVEINVSNHLKLYSNVDQLEFSPDGLIRSTAKPVTIPVYVINNGLIPVTIDNVRVTAANINYVTVHYEKVQIPTGIHQLTKIADLTINPYSIPKEITRIRGSVEIYPLSSYTDEPILRIPFRATILHGSLDYDREATYFYIPSSSIDSSNDKKEECRQIKLVNRFNTTMVIYNVTVDKMDQLSQYMNLKFSSPYIYADPGQAISPACVNILKQSSPSLVTLESTLTLHTNLSFFHMPIYLFSGLLHLDLLSDSTNGGIRRNDLNILEYFIASIPVNVSRTVKFMLKNANPVDILIDKISLTLPKANVYLNQMQLLNGSETKVPYKLSYKNDGIIELLIPARHQAMFSLIIHGTSEPSFYDEMITFKTSYQTLNMNVKYRITSGLIELQNKLPLHIDVFPNHVGTVDVFLNNRFDEPIQMIRVEFPTYGKSFSFIWNTTSPGRLIIEANKTYQIGKLSFDMKPLCNNNRIPSESTCYCGLNHHPEFKQQWNDHITTLNNNELDHILVSKFRNLWQDWTSLVRKQRIELTVFIYGFRIQTNFWLVTDQANISCPVTIGFVWPSVLEHMSSKFSRTPIILDFYLTLINTTKTQNIIITNPSSNVIQYSIELVGNYENTGNKKKKTSINNNQIFTIATTSKEVELINSIYKFRLQPNEHIIFTVSYRPKLSTKHEIYLVVRNNLTILESILLRGEGGKGSLTVGNRKAGSSDIPLLLEMNEKQYKLCSDYLSTNGKHGIPVLKKIVTLRNTGNMKIIIHDISFGNLKCSGQGFSVNVCSNIEIEQNERFDLHIRFQPDYTLAEIAESLTLFTNIGPMTFPIIVRIPQRILATCYQTMPRPEWEIQTHYICLCFVFLIFLCVLILAVLDGRKLFYDYLARAELRHRLSTTDPKLVGFTDITAAVQDAQKVREQIESRASTNTINPKKEISKDENKTKENDTKTKRSHSTINGSKDNGETLSKVSRNPDGTNIPVRPVATNSKAIPQKSKRTTTDNCLPKPTKNQHETSTKPQSLRTQKPTTTEQSTAVTSRSPTPPDIPLISVADEESEPFVVARSKRVSGKTKELTTSIVPVKSTPITDGVVPMLTRPSLPHLSPSSSLSPPVSEKSSSRSDLSEQRQNQKDLRRSSDTISDQQWQRVSSSRGLRKGSTATTTNRRETNDDPQKTNKTISNNTENPMVPPSSSCHKHTSVSNHQVVQSRRRRGRRLTRTISPTYVTILTNRKSLQNNEPISIRNRELAFRQLAEQLWAAGLPSSTTGCSLSVRSRCSSAPPSERGGDDEMTKISWNNGYHDEEGNIIDWDEPDKPDEDFGRYVSQTELCMDESNDNNEWTQQQQRQTSASKVNDISSFISTPPPPITSTNISQKITIPSAIIKADVEPLPLIQHGPGPIQRPNKLTSIPTQQSKSSSSSYFINSIQSPETPDVLDQINRLLDNQNSTTPITVPSTPNINDSSVPLNDSITPNIPWTGFLPTTWSSKYETSWPSTNIQSPTVSLATQVQNPFTLMSTINEQQRQSPREESSVWSSIMGTTTPRSLSSSTRTQRASIWNDLFSSTVPSSTEATKSTNNSLLKFWSAPDPSPTDGPSSNGHDIETNNSFWNLSTLTNESVVIPSTTSNQQQTSSSVWWSNSSSDENNNNDSQTNHLNDDTINNRDRSRWDFAR
ncbi:unnamed protein product [Rotaria sordida]|uniref:Transmembrane protein 131 n=1 Tax=Rotaria sordida TaxID=392033 RepID=A0A818K9S5_9BILA|nr:unnamed protein product [Rotaria sordida]